MDKFWKIFIIGAVIIMTFAMIFLPNPLNTRNVYVDPQGIAYLIFIPVLLGLIILYDKFIRNKRGGNSKGEIRRGWTEDEKESVRNRQGGVCNKCGRHPPRWEYHHKNGNRGDNSLNNCEGLCPNCHSGKTYG